MRLQGGRFPNDGASGNNLLPLRPPFQTGIWRIHCAAPVRGFFDLLKISRRFRAGLRYFVPGGTRVLSGIVTFDWLGMVRTTPIGRLAFPGVTEAMGVTGWAEGFLTALRCVRNDELSLNKTYNLSLLSDTQSYVTWTRVGGLHRATSGLPAIRKLFLMRAWSRCDPSGFWGEMGRR